MSFLLSPALALMQRLRLLPKFLVISCVFLVPLLLATGLLMAQLRHSVAAANLERRGLDYLGRLADVNRLAQRHRALEHLRLVTNANLDNSALTQQLQTRLAALDAWQHDAGELASLPGYDVLRQQATALRTAAPDAKTSLARHDALVAAAARLARTAADRSRLSLDPEVRTHRLAGAVLNTFPEIVDGLAAIAGQGGAFIDTGLWAGDEDAQLNTRAQLARHALAQVPERYAAIVAAHGPARAALQPKLAAVTASLAFLDRTRDEVTNSFNQTSGHSFVQAGLASVDGLHDLSRATATLLDGLLAERAARAALHRNLVLAAVAGTLAVAAWLLAGLYASFARDIARLERAVGAAAGGDLRVRVDSPARDETGMLANAFGGMLATLDALVAQARSGAARMAGAAGELADGHAGLSRQTAVQTQALSETVASMRELTAAVRHNGECVQRGAGIARTASAIALEGGAGMAAVVGKMGAIDASARRIADIIGVIDGIAFQTNILALNAAVEAARAGEQGRGFAVVAGEVRALAQRSATAALEVKQLIGDAVANVQAGSALADTAGATMEHVVRSVRQMARIIEEVGAAEAAQRRQIAALDAALARIDGVNRRNAELTLQASVGACRIEQETTALNGLLDRFRVSSGSIAESNVRCRTDSPKNGQSVAAPRSTGGLVRVERNRALMENAM